jgi:beta-lactamase regulating signal transducer with metallopeptidase domain
MNVLHPTMFAGSPFWRPAGEAMLEFLISGTAVAILFMLIRRVIGRLPATIRYAAASTAMSTLLALAGYQIWMHWPMTPSPGRMVTSGASPSVPLQSRAAAPAANPARSFPPAAVASQTSGRLTWEAAKPRLILALPALWLLGAPLTALFVGLGWTGAARLRRQSTPLIDDKLLARFARCQALMQVKHVGLAVCERIAAPIVVGILRPMILIPPALLTSLTCEQWEMILLHELAHVRRLDNLVNLLQRGVETVLFFHPAVWWASRWMRLEREHCCDAIVLRLGTSPQSYAETLAVLALPGIAPQLATAAMANHELLTRMRHILGTEDLPMTISWRKLAVAAVVFAAVGGLVANEWMSPSQRAAADENRQKQIEEKVLRQVLQELGVESPVDRVQLLLRENREAALQSVINEIEQLRAEARHEPLSMTGEGQLVFADRLIERLQGRRNGDEAFTRVRSGGQAPDNSWWAPNQMLGPPDVKEYGDDPKAWAARDPDHGDEWIRLGYQRPIKAAAILIYESFNPGAVTSVRIMGGGAPGEEIVWKATGEPKPGQSKNVLAIPIKDPSKILISAVNIHLDERRTSGWSEIDAVGLVDAETGETHWAQTAEASSTYASINNEPRFTDIILAAPQGQKAAWSPDQVVGPPDARPGTDDPRAWAAREADKGQEWLRVEFGDAYQSAGLLIHESLNAGAIMAVELVMSNGDKSSQAVEEEARTSGVAFIPVSTTGRINAVRLLIDEPKTPGWNEIDAVGLIDAATGQVHWATSATASSSFADVGPPEDALIFANPTQDWTSHIPDWHPRQATGAPDVPRAGDDGRAWASSSQDGQQESLELTFDPPVQSNLLLVYESFNPGALTEVSIRTNDVPGPGIMDAPGLPMTGSKVGWRSIWTGRDPVKQVDGKGIAAIPVPAGIGSISKVRLTLDSPAVPGWNEIDAVGLLDSGNGQVRWASDAVASSWFGEQGPGAIIPGGIPQPVFPQPPTGERVFDAPTGFPIDIGGGWESSTPGWHPSQATGAPNVREASDDPKAWASATPDGRKEWLELTYDPPVLASSLSIYESCNPGAISEVLIEEVDPIAEALPAGKDGFRTLAKGNQLYKQGRNGLGITMVTVKTNIRPIRRVRLLLDSPAAPGWNEIDAVGLLSTTGEMHWAKEAKASSWFGEGQAASGGPAAPGSAVSNFSWYPGLTR